MLRKNGRSDLDVQILASSSSGNCYALICDDSVLLLEAGIPVSKLRSRLTAPLSRVVACLISHEHKDHAGYARQYWDAGIQILSSPGTIENVGYGMSIPALDYFWEGWTITSFVAKHDAVDPQGFIIDAPDGTTVVFAIDTYLLPYIFMGVNVWMLECNYDLAILQDNIDAGLIPDAQAKRILQSHMSVDHVCTFLRAQDLSETRAVYLLHGSARNINKKAAADKVRGVVGVPVYWRT